MNDALPTVAHELVLLALDPRRGRCRSREGVDHAVAALLLAELAHRGRVAVSDGRLQVVADDATGVPCLDEALARLSQRRPVKLVQAVELVRYGAREQVLAELVEAGVVERTERSLLLGLYTDERHRPADPAAVQAIVDDLTSQLWEESPMTAHGLVLASGLETAQLDGKLLGQHHRWLLGRAMQSPAAAGLGADTLAILAAGHKAFAASQAARVV